jgi:hypothetical protein
MDEKDLRKVADWYGKTSTIITQLRAQRRPHAVLSTIFETIKLANRLSNVPRAFREELTFKYSADGLSAELGWLNATLRLVVHEEPHWIFPVDYELESDYHDFACTRLVAWESSGESEQVAGEILFFDNGEVHLTGCFGNQRIDVLTEAHQVVDQLFEWLLQEFRPRVGRQ